MVTLFSWQKWLNIKNKLKPYEIFYHDFCMGFKKYLTEIVFVIAVIIFLI